jgi:hypothetical protein
LGCPHHRRPIPSPISFCGRARAQANCCCRSWTPQQPPAPALALLVPSVVRHHSVLDLFALPHLNSLASFRRHNTPPPRLPLFFSLACLTLKFSAGPVSGSLLLQVVVTIFSTDTHARGRSETLEGGTESQTHTTTTRNGRTHTERRGRVKESPSRRRPRRRDSSKEARADGRPKTLPEHERTAPALVRIQSDARRASEHDLVTDHAGRRRRTTTTTHACFPRLSPTPLCPLPPPAVVLDRPASKELIQRRTCALRVCAIPLPGLSRRRSRPPSPAFARQSSTYGPSPSPSERPKAPPVRPPVVVPQTTS